MKMKISMNWNKQDNSTATEKKKMITEAKKKLEKLDNDLLFYIT